MSASSLLRFLALNGIVRRSLTGIFSVELRPDAALTAMMIRDDGIVARMIQIVATSSLTTSNLIGRSLDPHANLDGVCK